jgi:hypothetical protein
MIPKSYLQPISVIFSWIARADILRLEFMALRRRHACRARPKGLRLCGGRLQAAERRVGATRLPRFTDANGECTIGGTHHRREELACI